MKKGLIIVSSLGVLALIIFGVSRANAKTVQTGPAHNPDTDPLSKGAQGATTSTDKVIDNNTYKGTYQTASYGGPLLLQKGPTGKLVHPFFKHFNDESDAIAAGYKHGDRYKTPDGSIWAVNTI